MLWLPQAEFAGFYVAAADGLYDRAGLRVTVDHPSPNEELFDTLRDGGADLIVGWPIAALERAAAGEDVRNVGQLARRSSLMLIARRDSGISVLEDIRGRRVGLWPAPSLRAPMKVFLAHYDVRDYSVLPVLTNADLFLYGGVDATSAVYYDEYYRIRAAGIDPGELICFPLNSAFPRLVDDGLYCRSPLVKAHPRALLRFREATLEGWRRALADPARALGLVKARCREVGFFFNPPHQRWMLEAMGKLIFPPGEERHRGEFRRDEFDQVADIIKLDRERLRYENFAPSLQEETR